MKNFIIKIDDQYFSGYDEECFDCYRYPDGIYEIPFFTALEQEAKIYNGTINVLSDTKRLMLQQKDDLVKFKKLEIIMIN